MGRAPERSRATPGMVVAARNRYVMQTPQAAVSEHFLADHRRLEALLRNTVSALETNDQVGASGHWAECCSGLLTHMDAEERNLVPALLQRSERDARVLVQEHRHIRSRLTALSAEMASQRIRADSVRDFLDEFHAHSQSEDRLLYQWVDAYADEPSRVRAIGAIARI
jgi:hypothetical protein